ncbi:unnamed protein product [Rhodiola kirilowii]
MISRVVLARGLGFWVDQAMILRCSTRNVHLIGHCIELNTTTFATQRSWWQKARMNMFGSGQDRAEHIKRDRYICQI